MTDFVVSAWNGRIHTAVDHLGGPKHDRPLGRELKRIPLTSIGAAVSLRTLTTAFGREITSARKRIEREQRA